MTLPLDVKAKIDELAFTFDGLHQWSDGRDTVCIHCGMAESSLDSGDVCDEATVGLLTTLANYILKSGVTRGNLRSVRPHGKSR